MPSIVGLNFSLCFAIFAAVLGMFQFGYNTGVINSPEVNIENFIMEVYEERHKEKMDQTTAVALYSLAVSLFAIGGMIGGFFGGFIANKYGRKNGILLNCSVGIIGAIFLGITKETKQYEMLFVGRFIIGINCGLYTSLVPMYISEISPVNLRGGLGTVNQLGVTVGLLLSQVLGIEQILGNNNGWPILLALTAIPVILQSILLFLCPESPRYLLINKQREGDSRYALQKLRQTQDVDEEIEEMKAEERAHQSEASVTMLQLITSPNLRTPLIIGVVMHLSQQFSGINAVFYYSTSIFLDSGLSEEGAKFATIGIGVIMVVMTLVSIPLMDKAGRRTLHLWGLGGMCVFSIILTISFAIMKSVSEMSYISVLAILYFVIFFAVGPGSIPWMITAELFSQGPRPAAMSIAVLVNWLANFLVGISFPSMKTALDIYTFIPFTILLLIFWLFTYKRVPETKNKTFEEIAEIFRRSSNTRLVSESRVYS